MNSYDKLQKIMNLKYDESVKIIMAILCISISLSKEHIIALAFCFHPSCLWANINWNQTVLQARLFPAIYQILIWLRDSKGSAFSLGPSHNPGVITRQYAWFKETREFQLGRNSTSWGINSILFLRLSWDAGNLPHIKGHPWHIF